MPEQTECIADDGRLHVVKLQRRRRRELEVDVLSPDGRCVDSLALPRGVDRASIEGLNPQSTYRVRVRRRHRLTRYRHPEREFHVRPQTRDLRVLVTGSGRCGTKTLANYLNGQHFADGTVVNARHEPLAHWMLDAFIAGDREFPVMQQRGALHNVESAPYYSIYPDVIRAQTVVLLIRDGRRVVQSGLNRGWYARASRWDYIKPNYGVGQFESSCRLWVDCNRNAAARADHIFRLEDLILGGDHLQELDSAVNLLANDKALPHSNRGAQTSTSFAAWTDEQCRKFDEVCGELMDSYYPGWRGAEEQ